MRHTDKNGLSYVTDHLVYDSDLFLAARQEEAKKLGGKSAVAQISEEEYRKERKAK